MSQHTPPSCLKIIKKMKKNAAALIQHPRPTKLKKETNLTIMKEVTAHFAVQCKCCLVLAVLVLPDFGPA